MGQVLWCPELRCRQCDSSKTRSHHFGETLSQSLCPLFISWVSVRSRGRRISKAGVLFFTFGGYFTSPTGHFGAPLALFTPINNARRSARQHLTEEFRPNREDWLMNSTPPRTSAMQCRDQDF